MANELLQYEKAYFDVLLEGSDEDTREDLQDLLREAYGGDGYSDPYICIKAVFSAEGYAIFQRCVYGGDEDGTSYFKQAFTIGTDQEPVLSGEPTAITVTIGDAVEDDEDTYIMLGTDVVSSTKAALNSGGGSRKRSSLKDSDFAYVEPGHKVDGVTPDKYRHYPIYDKSHVRNAMARLSGDQSPFAAKAKRKVMAAARKYGVGTAAKSGAKWFNALPEAADKSFADKLKAIVSKVVGDASPDRPCLTLTKDVAGRTRFVCYPTNNYVDREDELFTAESHSKAIDWYYSKKAFPELWVWHTKGTKFGQVDWMDFVQTEGHTKAAGGGSVGGVVVASGLIDPGFEELAARLATKDFAMSHGFLGIREKEGSPRAWTDYLDYEISVLPKSAVANYGTSFNLTKEKKGDTDMAFNAERKALLKTQFGIDDATIQKMEKDTDALSTGLAGLGIASKELGIADPEPDPNPAPPPPDLTAGVAGLVEQHTKEIGLVVAAAKAKVEAAEARAAAAEKSLADTLLKYTPRAAAPAAAVVASASAATEVPINDPAVQEAIASGTKEMEGGWLGGAIQGQLHGAGLDFLGGRGVNEPLVIGAAPAAAATVGAAAAAPGAALLPTISPEAATALAGFGS